MVKDQTLATGESYARWHSAGRIARDRNYRDGVEW